MASEQESLGRQAPRPGCDHDHAFGGQAVIEGVMMRGKRSWSVAVRRPSGGIERVSFALPAATERNSFYRLPVVRGVVALYESLSLGIKALGVSANIGLEEAAAADAEAAGGDDAMSDSVTREGAVTNGAMAQVGSGGAETVIGEAGAAGSGAAKVVQKAPYQFGWRELAGTVVFS